MKVIIANDHAGVELKKRLKGFLEGEDIAVTNLGVDSLERVDYPDICKRATDEYLSKCGTSSAYTFGILICGTGIGMSIAANKVVGIRCALAINPFAAEMARRHNDANFLALAAKREGVAGAEAIKGRDRVGKYLGGKKDFGAREIYETSCEILRAYLCATHDGGRHLRRVEKIKELESLSLHK